MRAPWLWGIIILCILSTSFSACNRAETPEAKGEKRAVAMGFMLKSSAFEDGAMIPQKYSCEGDNVSPPLSWSGAPKGTKSLALICDDPDAATGTYVHWLLWNLPPDTLSLPEGAPPEIVLADVQQGLESWPPAGYFGPCPPPGKPHRYFFKLYALDTELTLPVDAEKVAIEQAMEGHILAQTQLMGRYGR
jgi:Raf kinase inhibitor-like YbhB/YbcL family protein